jgi:retinol dehydrogenase 12
MTNELDGKVMIVTGASTGIGKESARALAGRGATVVMVSKDKARAEAALEDIRATTGSSKLESVTADLSLVSDARRVGKELAARLPRLDVLLNNAGLVVGQRTVTAEGIELSLAINHLAHFVLIQELRGLLEKSAPSRVIYLLGRGAPINFEDPQFEKGYQGFDAYGRAKMWSLAALAEWSRRLAGTGVTVNAAFPGIVDTPGMGNVPGIFGTRLARFFMRTPAKGAQSSIYVATAKELERETGRLYTINRPMTSQVPKGWDDPTTGKRVWEETEKMIARAEAAAMKRSA